MYSVLNKYFLSKEKELISYANEIAYIFSYTPEVLIDNRNNTIKSIIHIYINKYYKIDNINYDLVSKYYRFNDETDIDYKTIFQATVEYFNNNNIKILENNDKIVYLSYVIYFAFLIDKLRETIVLIPSKLEFIISIAGKVSKSFSFIKSDKSKKHCADLINLIKTYIRNNNKMKKTIDNAINNVSYNNYISISDEVSIYKLKYNAVLPELKKYKRNDINKLYIRENIDNTFKIMSYQLSEITLLKCIIIDQRIDVAIEMNKNFYTKKSNIMSLLKLINSNYSIIHTKIIIDAKEYEENENLNKLKNVGIKIIINSDIDEEINKISFDENMLLLTSREYILNNKSELENKKIKYIKKSIERTYNEKDLFVTKVDFMEVNNE